MPSTLQLPVQNTDTNQSCSQTEKKENKKEEEKEEEECGESFDEEKYLDLNESSDEDNSDSHPAFN